MQRLTDAELLALLDDPESDRVERKQSLKGDVPKKARQAICAFANDLPNHQQPGVLFIGANDDGTPSNHPITDSLLRSLADMKTDGNILPLPVLTVEKRTLKQAEMAVVTVMPSDMPPVRYAGRIWVRTGPRRSIANEQEQRILIERRRFRLLPYDLQPVTGATLQDLSRVFFEEEFLPQAIAKDTLAADDRSFAERLAACRMIVSPDEPVPTVTGILTLGRKPQDFIPGARIQFLRINGTEWGDEVVDEQRIDGTLAQQISVLDQKMQAHNRVSVDIVSGPKEIRRYRFPMAALQQLTRNAVMHRSYDGTHAPIMVYWFNDRIEIINAGGPYGRVTPENFGKPGFADYRNPDIAESMKVLDLVQRFGVGIQTAQRELANNGNPPPAFEMDTHSLVCRVYPITHEEEVTDTAHAGSSTRQVPDKYPASALQVAKAIKDAGAPLARAALQEAMQLSDRDHFSKAWLQPALTSKLVAMTIPDKPRSSKQKYQLTELGKQVLEQNHE